MIIFKEKRFLGGRVSICILTKKKNRPALGLYNFKEDERKNYQALYKFIKRTECWVSFDRGFSCDFQSKQSFQSAVLGLFDIKVDVLHA